MVFRSVSSVRGLQHIASGQLPNGPGVGCGTTEVPVGCPLGAVARPGNSTTQIRIAITSSSMATPTAIGTAVSRYRCGCTKEKMLSRGGVVVWFAMSPAPCSSYSATPRGLEPGRRWGGRPGLAVGDYGEALKVSFKRCAPVVMCRNDQPPETVCPYREAAYPVPLDDSCTAVLGL
jgi:hypothetical protein